MMPFMYEFENFRGAPIYHQCPGCGNDKTYQRYAKRWTDKKELISDIGECNSCSYRKEPSTEEKIPFFINDATFSESLNRFADNNLLNFLKNKYGLDKATKAMNEYFIGTSNAFKGATVFWQIDGTNKVRTGKISLFNTHTGEEDIKGWVHQRLKVSSMEIRKCMFGQHLLMKEPNKTVVIVEDEKTAIEASCKHPEYLWLCAHGFPPDGRAKMALENRKFICKPETWKKKNVDV